MSFDNDEMLVEFITDAKDNLQDVENKLLKIEADGADFDIELLNTVFRAIHSVKGGAGFMGLSKICDLSHSMENVLNLMRKRELANDSAIIDVLLASLDSLEQLIANVKLSDEIDILELVDALNVIASGEPAPKIVKPVAVPKAPEPTAPVVVEPTPQPVVEPAVVATPATTDDTLLQSEVTVELARPAPEKNLESGVQSAASESPTTNSGGSQSASSVRVSVSVLDHLMNLAGELVLSRNQLLQAVTSDSDNALETVASGLDQITSESQEAIMQTRLQPIGNTFSRFPRVIRDLSTKLGKQCELNIEGKDVEVDKTILEAISDPLTHLIRNSIDHGIEKPEVRAKAGKNAIRKVDLNAYHRAGKVCIDIHDDGGGINGDALKQKAITKGILTSEAAEQMGEREVLRLIFHPGFSTAEQLSDVSGRGVGMDVVRTNIENLGGTVEIESTVGVGTSIRITLPLTLAIIPSLIVQCKESRYAIPQVNIAELVRIRPNELAERVGRVKNAEVLRLRGTLLPLVRLSEALPVSRHASSKVETEENDGPSDDVSSALNIIVVEAGHFRYGIVVDSLHDSEEIVVKPLGRHLKQSICLAGATILGDGHVALIVDISGISTQVELREDVSGSQQSTTGETSHDGESQLVLLFRNSEQEQFAVPMSIISRLEPLRASQIDSIGGQQVLQYRGGTLSLMNLEDVINAQPRPDLDRMYVIVFEYRGKEVGVVAPFLADIREIPLDNIDTVTFHEPGVIGSLVISEHTTRVLDLYKLLDKAHPEWCQTTQRQVGDSDQKRTVLLVEDSNFFRQQVEDFLKTDGFKVICCEDGQDGWETLLERFDEIDTVITDIEMPRLDGYGLCERIRNDPQLSQMPVIALTSLAGDEDVVRGQEVGIDDYLIKMDRKTLREAVQRHSERGAALKDSGRPQACLV